MKWNNIISNLNPLVVYQKLSGSFINRQHYQLIKDSELFDQEYYLGQYPDVKEKRTDPVIHYLTYGGFEGRNPGKSFNSLYYYESNPDVLKEGINPLLHYLLRGKKEGRKPFPVAPAIKANKGVNVTADERKLHGEIITGNNLSNQEQDIQLIRNSEYFNEEYYLSTNPDVKNKGLDPVNHFYYIGFKEWRNPSEKFDTRYYLETNPAVMRSGVNPLLHFIKFGRKENRRTLPEIHETQFVNEPDTKPVVTEIENNSLAQELEIKLLKESSLFDEEYYLSNNQDVKDAGVDPYEHYYLQGWRDGRNPSSDFDTEFYLASYKDVKETEQNPLVHYLTIGKLENRVCTVKDKIKLEKGHAFELPLSSTKEQLNSLVKTVAFYLPQFHPIPENNEWWGNGFTEWKNVVTAKPLFQEHYQPHLPYDLGFYDLRVPEVMAGQVRMAKEFGIHGFCFYYYWFDGKRLLEKPLDMFLEHKEWDINFCVCWANENWTRRWDGRDDDILIAQNHSPEDDLRVIADISKYTRDPRYIRINGKPLLIIYRADIFPDIKTSIVRWREYYLEQFNEELCMAMVQTFGLNDPDEFGFDYAIEFPPLNISPDDITSKIKTENFFGKILDTGKMIKNTVNKLRRVDYNMFRGVMLMWDNTARKGNHSHVYLNNPPGVYRDWLMEACNDTMYNSNRGGDNLVFINAWNEWAEGAHLEPDKKYGYSYLNATKSVLAEINETNFPMISVIVPNYNHAKYLRQRLDSVYGQTYRNIEIILLDDASTDSSLEILEEYYNKYKSITRLLVNEHNVGNVFSQWMKGMSEATGDLIWIAESDDYCDLNFLKTLSPFFTDEAVCLTYSKILFVDEKGNTHSRSFDDYVEIIDDTKWKNSYKETSSSEVRAALGIKNTIPNVSSVLFRKPEEIELFHNKEWLDMRICGDWIFYLNILRGGKIAYSIDTMSYYRIHDDNSSIKTYTQDVYYKEHEKVALEIARNYSVPEDLLLKNRSIIHDFYNNYKSESTKNFEVLFSESKTLDAINDRKINIVISLLSFIHGGGEIMPIRLANQLKLMGYPVTVHSPDYFEEENEVRKLLRKDIPVVRCKEPEELYSFLLSFRADIFNTHSQSCQDLYSKTIAKFPDLNKFVTHVGTLHGGYEIMDEKYQLENIPVNNQSTKMWTYVADKNLIPFKELGIDMAAKSIKIANGMEPPVIREIKRSDLGINSNSFVLCIVSRAIPEKGWLEAIEIVKMARENTKIDIHLLLLGDGELYDYLKDEKVPEFVHLLGFNDNPCDYFTISDMGFLPSTYKAESFPLSIVESLFVGKPVIASNLGEVAKMIHVDGQYAGAIFELKNGKIPVKEVVDIMISYASDIDLYKMACRNAEKCRMRYNLKNVAISYLDAYNLAITDIKFNKD